MVRPPPPRRGNLFGRRACVGLTPPAAQPGQQLDTAGWLAGRLAASPAWAVCFGRTDGWLTGRPAEEEEEER